MSWRQQPNRKSQSLILCAIFSVILTLAACNSVQENSVPEIETQAAAYQQDATGRVRLEAETNQGNVTRNAQSWQLVSDSAAQGGKTMQALPDSGVTNTTGYTSSSPQLDYTVNFNRSGKHYIWVRGKAKSGAADNSDSVHVGLDGKAVSSADNIKGFGTSLGWSNSTIDGPVATVEVSSAGVHTVNVWMREDGFTVDALEVSSSPSRGSSLPSVQAKSAASFIATMGVNTHLAYLGTVYDTRYSDVIKPKLLALGVRHIRDGAETYAGIGPETSYYKRLRELGAAGFRFNLITSLETPYHDVTDYTKLGDIVAWTEGAVSSFEGINEPDQQGISDWANLTTAAQKKLYATVRGNAALKDVKVLGPSPVFGGGKLPDLSSYLDYGNIHPYPSGKMPTGSEDTQSTKISLKDAARNSGTKPVIITETGYHNALETTGNHLPASEAVAAKYLPRLFLEHFNLGIPRSYLYELIDSKSSGRLTNPEASFGLLRFDGSEKPAFKALKSLTTLLADSDFSTPGTLSFSLSGATANVHTTLLQKRDGTFYLAFWLEATSWDRRARQPISVPAQKVTMTLGASVANATLYSLDDTGQLTSKGVSFQNKQLELNALDSVSLLKLHL